MARKRRPHRHERTDVEMRARRWAVLYPSMLDQLPEESLALAEEIRDEVAIIQRGWDETTEWLRSLGVTSVPRDSSLTPFLERLRRHASHRFPPFIRVFPVDRPLVSFSYWLRQDVEVGLPPDELAAEVERAMQNVRGLWVGASSVPDDGPAPSDDAVPLGPARAWERNEDWIYTTHRLEAPLDAVRAQRFDVAGNLILRVDDAGHSFFIQDAKRSERAPPTE
jgi:hypothetical protein